MPLTVELIERCLFTSVCVCGCLYQYFYLPMFFCCLYCLVAFFAIQIEDNFCFSGCGLVFVVVVVAFVSLLCTSVASCFIFLDNYFLLIFGLLFSSV